MRRSEELERVAKEDEGWAKEEELSKEEEVASWTRTIEALEKIYKGFYSYKDYRLGKFKSEPLWTCEGKYKDEDKAACKNEVIKILKQCKKEDILINRPSIANLIYVNRLRKRGDTKEDNEMEESLTQAEEIKEERLDINETVTLVSKGKEDEDMDKEWSKHIIERWGNFLRSLENKDNVDGYCKWLEMVKEKSRAESVNKIIEEEGLVKKEYEEWEEEEDKKICWLEVVKILKVCNEEELINSNPYAVQQLYIDRLIRNGFVEEVEKAGKVVLLGEASKIDDTTEQRTVSDEAELKKDKEATDKTASEAVTIREQKGKEGLAALQEYPQLGIGLIGAYDNGATIAKGDDYEKAFTCDLHIIELTWKGKNERAKWQSIRRYYFKPKAAGLICLDIDCKNGKDGISEFYNFCRTRGKSKEQLPKMLQELPNNFPCFVKTPNGGYHLYFKERGEREVKIPHLPKAPSVEVKTKQLTAAGSFKDGKPYILYGDISAAPLLPIFIKNAIFNTETMKKNPREKRVLFPKQKGKQRVKSLQQKKDWEKPSWDKITEWTQEDKFLEISGGRNKRAFHLALKANTHKYTFDETLNEILNDTTVNSLPEREIRDVVKSAYKN
jgi:hypothetical protein